MAVSSVRKISFICIFASEIFQTALLKVQECIKIALHEVQFLICMAIETIHILRHFSIMRKM